MLQLSCQVARRGQYDLNFDLRNDGVCSDRLLKVNFGNFLLQMALKQQILVFFLTKNDLIHRLTYI